MAYTDFLQYWVTQYIFILLVMLILLVDKLNKETILTLFPKVDKWNSFNFQLQVSKFMHKKKNVRMWPYESNSNTKKHMWD